VQPGGTGPIDQCEAMLEAGNVKALTEIPERLEDFLTEA
jgi:hypothetical protein